MDGTTRLALLQALQAIERPTRGVKDFETAFQFLEERLGGIDPELALAFERARWRIKGQEPPILRS